MNNKDESIEMLKKEVIYQLSRIFGLEERGPVNRQLEQIQQERSTLKLKGPQFYMDYLLSHDLVEGDDEK